MFVSVIAFWSCLYLIKCHPNKGNDNAPHLIETVKKFPFLVSSEKFHSELPDSFHFCILSVSKIFARNILLALNLHMKTLLVKLVESLSKTKPLEPAAVMFVGTFHVWVLYCYFLCSLLLVTESVLHCTTQGLKYPLYLSGVTSVCRIWCYLQIVILNLQKTSL